MFRHGPESEPVTEQAVVPQAEQILPKPAGPISGLSFRTERPQAAEAARQYSAAGAEQVPADRC